MLSLIGMLITAWLLGAYWQHGQLMPVIKDLEEDLEQLVEEQLDNENNVMSNKMPTEEDLMGIYGYKVWGYKKDDDEYPSYMFVARSFHNVKDRKWIRYTRDK